MTGAMNTSQSSASMLKGDTPAQAVRIAELEAQVVALQTEMQSLTASISHDLRAPLRHITSFAQLVQEEAGPQLNAEMREFLGHISSAAKRLGSMLDGLLALSRIGTVALHPEPVDLAELVQTLVQERKVALQSQASGRVVVWTVDKSPWLTVQADARVLRQTLGHVLDNALQFSGSQLQLDIGVTVSVDVQAGELYCTVSDSGVGFAPEQAALLFKPFVRLNNSSQHPGLGMGLALVRKGLQRMGADVGISATLQDGCQVVLRLPLASADF